MNKAKEVEENKDVIGLKKELGLPEAIAVVIGVVIGSGVFFKPSIVFKNAGAPGLGILAWVVGGIITIAAGLTVAEIASAIPKTGGLFSYLRELYGGLFAFLLGWVQTLIYVPGSTAALAIIFATQSTYFIPLTKSMQIILAIIMIIFITIINIVSTKFSGKFQLVSTIAKLIPIFAIGIFGLILGTVHDFTPIVGTASTTGGFGAAILGTLWAYDGWINVGNIAGELKNPEADLPKSIVLGLLIVIIAYMIVNIAVINILPMESVVASEKPVSDAAAVIFGRLGAGLIAIGILISILGTMNGYMITGSRVPFAMANEGLLPFRKFFGGINEKHSTPSNALIFESVLACLYVFTGSFNTLTDLVVFVLWIFFTMAVAGIFILRKNHSHLQGKYKVPLYPITPLVGIIGGLFILVNTLFTSTLNALYGLGITLIGVPVYLYVKRKSA